MCLRPRALAAVVPGYTLGCGIPTAPFGPFTTIANINDRGDARYDSLQVKAETKSVRHGLYVLLGYTYARNFDNGFNDGLGSSTGVTYLPLPGTHARGLELVSNPAQSQFHRQRALRSALRQRQALWQQLERGPQRGSGKLANQRDRKNHFGIPRFRYRQQQQFGRKPDQQRKQLYPSRPDLQSQGRQRNLKQVVQHPVLCGRPSRGTGKCSPGPSLRT